MEQTQNIKASYYFDEAGDTQIFGHHGVNLLEKGTASKTFIVGYLECVRPKEFTKALNTLKTELANDEYLTSIPSFHHSLGMFHANKDCAEVREKVYKVLKQQDFSFYCIVARKKEDILRKKFNLNSKQFYKYLVAKLLENKLHLYKEIDLYFSAMGNTVRQSSMQEAVDNAINSFNQKSNTKNTNTIRIFIQQNSEIPLLQAADYMLWAVQRAYERKDFRYYNFMKDKISLIHDIFDFQKYPNNSYSQKNPLGITKIEPL